VAGGAQLGEGGDGGGRRRGSRWGHTANVRPHSTATGLAGVGGRV
jgi:hypothetical protein